MTKLNKTNISISKQVNKEVGENFHLREQPFVEKQDGLMDGGDVPREEVEVGSCINGSMEVCAITDKLQKQLHMKTITFFVIIIIITITST